MTNDNLTLLGKEPYLKDLVHLVEYSSKDELRERVKRLFISEDALVIMYPPGSGHGWGGTADEAIDYLLKLLPANHETVQEILYRADLILNESTNMSALELKAALGMARDPPELGHLLLAFQMGEDFSPDSIYADLKTAAYHLANENIKCPEILGKLSWIAEAGILGYRHKKRGEVLEFINFLEENKLIKGYSQMYTYAKLGDEKAIRLFIEALKRNDEDIDKFAGKIIKEKLIENGFSEDALKKLVYNISEPKIRDKAREYLMI